jgi:hypothetical protein
MLRTSIFGAIEPPHSPQQGPFLERKLRHSPIYACHPGRARDDGFVWHLGAIRDPLRNLDCVSVGPGSPRHSASHDAGSPGMTPGVRCVNPIGAEVVIADLGSTRALSQLPSREIGVRRKRTSSGAFGMGYGYQVPCFAGGRDYMTLAKQGRSAFALSRGIYHLTVARSRGGAFSSTAMGLRATKGV